MLRRSPNRVSFLLIGALALAAAVLGALLARATRDAPVELHTGTWLPRARPVAAFTLTDQQGKPYTEQRLKGHPSLVFFGFTHCPDICPTTLALLAQLQREPPIPLLQTILVSVDPRRDTVQAMQRYLAAFNPQFIGLTGGPPGLDALAHSLGAVHVERPLPGGDYMVDHSATLYLLNSQGELAAVFTPPLTLQGLKSDLRIAAKAMRHGAAPVSS